MNDSAALMYLVVIEYKVSVRGYLAVLVEQESCCIEVEVKAAVILVGVPSESDEDLIKSGVGLCKIYFLTLG